ncbi:MAG: hypothetical protein E7H06_00470 [Enterobacter asburiae]|uniref:hypothetical protein n=1 Tax=Citrobacter freundii TaxID=546 RepID=UPI001781CA5E|nr:hypothetical protein [Citrobacter freundii]MDU3925551.1 hypothetical protein [Enterobacter asburiae]UVV93649.1 hypothetical protein NYE91_12545 [Citrobacter freundii]
MEFTKEQLIERVMHHKATAELFAEDAVKSTNAKMDVRIFEAALAALTSGMEQEPIYQLRDMDWYDTDQQTYDAVVNAGGAGRIVYAAPQLPQPAVDESAIFDAAIDICRKSDSIDEHAWNHGVLAVMSAFRRCRAAMLQGNHRDLSYPVDPQVAEYEKIMQQAVPDGWVAVPVEPTQEMLNAWLSEIANWRGHVAGYKAMLAAVPQQEAK